MSYHELSATALTSREKDEYWIAVELCLVEFYKIPNEYAGTMVSEKRKNLERAIGDSPAADIIYHDEPSYVAVTMMGCESNNFNQEKYDEIVDRLASDVYVRRHLGKEDVKTKLKAAAQKWVEAARRHEEFMDGRYPISAVDDAGDKANAAQQEFEKLVDSLEVP